MMTVTRVATGGAPVPDMILMNMPMQVTFHIYFLIAIWTLKFLFIIYLYVLSLVAFHVKCMLAGVVGAHLFLLLTMFLSPHF